MNQKEKDELYESLRDLAADIDEDWSIMNDVMRRLSSYHAELLRLSDFVRELS